jgi:nucleotide-binding universal stress UspA family protein
MHPKSPATVVVGIDGSESALRAAEWAVDEAVSRCLPLRLIHAIEPGSEAIRLEKEYAEASLRAARAAVDAVGRRVHSDAVVLRGNIIDVLMEESRHAAMMCVGSSGVDYPFGKSLGSVAGAMAQSAHCPTAVIRTPDLQSGASRCIAAVVGDPNTADAVLRAAMDEARLRSASLLVLRVWPATRGSACDDHMDRRMTLWARRYPDVQIHPVVAYTSLAEFLTRTDRSILLAIVDTVNGAAATRLIGPSVVSRAQCSVMVVDPGRRSTSSKPRRPVNASLRLRTTTAPLVDQFVSLTT